MIERSTFIPGIGLFALGLTGFVVALFNFRNAPHNQPATKGLYSISRHPQAVMLFLSGLGMCVAVGSGLVLLMLAIAEVVSHFRILAEEEVCLEQYGNISCSFNYKGLQLHIFMDFHGFEGYTAQMESKFELFFNQILNFFKYLIEFSPPFCY